MRWRLSAGLAALVLAAAQTPPPRYLPTRDVRVTYRLDLTGPHPEQAVLRFDAASGRARIDAGPLAYAIVDRPAGQLTLVVDAFRSFVRRPFDAAAGYGLGIDAGARFTQGERDTVAGVGCRVWSVRAARGEATACLTPDGVILRARFSGARGGGAIEATEVAYAPQPAAMFAVPADYAPFPVESLPRMLRGLLPAG